MESEVIAKLLESGVIATMLGMLLWWLTTRIEKLLVKVIKQQAIHSLVLTGLAKQCLTHDLTVTGLNPSTGNDPATRESKALAKYDELLTIYRQIESQITDA
jgi:hypothetical protein